MNPDGMVGMQVTMKRTENFEYVGKNNTICTFLKI